MRIHALIRRQSDRTRRSELAARVPVITIEETEKTMATRYKIGRPTLALLAAVLAGVVVPGTVLAQASTLPTACLAVEALVGNQSGPTPGGEVIRVDPTTQSTLTSDTSPAGGPDLVQPADLAYLANGDLVVADPGGTTGAPRIVEVNPYTGVRTLVSGQTSATGPTTGIGPA